MDDRVDAEFLERIKSVGLDLKDDLSESWTLVPRGFCKIEYGFELLDGVDPDGDHHLPFVCIREWLGEQIDSFDLLCLLSEC